MYRTLTLPRNVCVVAYSALLIHVGAVHGSSEVTTADVIAAWKERQAANEAVRIEWDQHQLQRRGSIVPPQYAQVFELQGKAARIGVPLEDVEVTFPCTFATRGRWMRYAAYSPAIFKTGQLGFNFHESAYDGESSKMLSIPSDPRRGAGLGSNRNENRNTDSRSYPLMPLMFHLRPLEKEFTGIDVNELHIVRRGDMVRDIPCVVVGDQRKQLWLDPARGFVVLRWHSLSKEGKVRYAADMTYTEAEGAWILESWAIDELDDDGDDGQEAVSRREVIVRKYELAPDLDGKAFDLEFPPGTLVYDYKQSHRYIQLENGGKRILPPPASFRRHRPEL